MRLTRKIEVTETAKGGTDAYCNKLQETLSHPATLRKPKVNPCRCLHGAKLQRQIRELHKLGSPLQHVHLAFCVGARRSQLFLHPPSDLTKTQS